MVREPAALKVVDGNRLEAEGCRRARFQLRIDLRGHSPCDFPIRTDARPVALTVFCIAEIPDRTTQIGAHAVDAKRHFSTRHETSVREDPRHKVPQTGFSEDASEMQVPVSHSVMAHGQTNERRGGDSNPRSPCGDTAFPVLHNRPLCHLSKPISGEWNAPTAIVRALIP